MNLVHRKKWKLTEMDLEGLNREYSVLTRNKTTKNVYTKKWWENCSINKPEWAKSTGDMTGKTELVNQWPENKDSGRTFLFCFLFKYHHHHHVVLVARISLTLSRHFSLSFIASGRSSGQHPVSSHSCWMYVRAGRPAFARPCVGVHKSTSLMSSSLLLQQCPACPVRLTWIVFVIGGRWPYSWCLVGCCRQDLFKIARSKILIQFFYHYD